MPYGQLLRRTSASDTMTSAQVQTGEGRRGPESTRQNGTGQGRAGQNKKRVSVPFVVGLRKAQIEVRVDCVVRVSHKKHHVFRLERPVAGPIRVVGLHHPHTPVYHPLTLRPKRSARPSIMMGSDCSREVKGPQPIDTLSRSASPHARKEHVPCVRPTSIPSGADVSKS